MVEPAPAGKVTRRHSGVFSATWDEEHAQAGRAAPHERGAFLLDLLTRLEATADTRSLLFFLHPDDRPAGGVTSAGGQICLVTLSDQHGQRQVPLGERVRERHPEAATAIREALVRARDDGRPLGEALAALGTVPSGLVRDALLDQFADGLAVLDDAGPGLVEEALSSTRRLPTVLSAFAPVDVYFRTVARLSPIVSDEARACYEELGADVDRAALVAHGGVPLMVAARGVAPASVAEIEAIDRFVQRTIRPPALVAAGISPRVVVLGSDDGAILALAGRAQTAILIGARPRVRARAFALARRLFPDDA